MILSVMKRSLNCFLNLQVPSYAYRTDVNLFVKHFNFRRIQNLRPYCVSEKLQERWVTVTLLRSDGSRFQRRGKVGSRVKELILESDDPDFDGFAMCGGCVMCASCQFIFPREYFEKLPKPSDDEHDLLSFTDLSDRSRCGCCIDITEEMDGMVLEIPPRN